MTTTGPITVSMLRDGKVTTTTLHPQQLGFNPARPEDLLGGDPQQNADITRQILNGTDRSAKRDAVLLNAAAALVVGGKADSLKEGIAMAAKSIDDGAALKVLENLVAFSQKAAQ
jgi:anthranilate phosphoribosyltransferase